MAFRLPGRSSSTFTIEIGCRTLFATHYHELTELAESHPGVTNLNVAVKEWQDKVVFLHKIVPGSADKSYGIHVAQLAGVPREVTDRAINILAQLEAQHLDGKTTRPATKVTASRKSGEYQLTLFEMAEHPVVDEIRRFRIDTAAPLEALQQIKQWQDAVMEDQQAAKHR